MGTAPLQVIARRALRELSRALLLVEGALGHARRFHHLGMRLPQPLFKEGTGSFEQKSLPGAACPVRQRFLLKQQDSGRCQRALLQAAVRGCASLLKQGFTFSELRLPQSEQPRQRPAPRG